MRIQPKALARQHCAFTNTETDRIRTCHHLHRRISALETYFPAAGFPRPVLILTHRAVSVLVVGGLLAVAGLQKALSSRSFRGVAPPHNTCPQCIDVSKLRIATAHSPTLATTSHDRSAHHHNGSKSQSPLMLALVWKSQWFYTLAPPLTKEFTTAEFTTAPSVRILGVLILTEKETYGNRSTADARTRRPSGRRGCQSLHRFLGVFPRRGHKLQRMLV